MKMMTFIVKMALVFDLVYVGFVCMEDLCLRIHKRFKTKKESNEFDFEETEDIDYSFAPALCVDAIRMLSKGDVQEFVEKRIFTQEKAIMETLSASEREMVLLLLEAYIGFLVEDAPFDERNFPTLLELFDYAEPYGEEKVDLIEMVMQERCKRQTPKPEYYCNYQKYKIVCPDRARINEICRVIVTDLLAVLYHGYHNFHFDALLYEPLSKQLVKTAADDTSEEWEGEEDAFSDC